MSQDVTDDRALQLSSQIDQLGTRLGTIRTQVNAAFATHADEAWTAMLTETELSSVAFSLNEARDLARQILVSSEFAALHPASFEALGDFEFKGVGEKRAVYAPK